MAGARLDAVLAGGSAAAGVRQMVRVRPLETTATTLPQPRHITRTRRCRPGPPRRCTPRSERGDLDDWRRLVAEVRRDPRGRIARQIEEALTHSRPYGIAEAMETVLVRIREQAEAGERAEVAQEVRGLITRSGLSRTKFAARIGISASRPSMYATGRVTPSAALLVRMRRVAAAEQTPTPHAEDPAGR